MTAPDAAPMRKDMTADDFNMAHRFTKLGNNKEFMWNHTHELAALFTEYRLAHTSRPDAGDEDVERVADKLLARAEECRKHAEASFYPRASSEYRAKEAAFREAAVIAAMRVVHEEKTDDTV